jgi:outer membrane protein
MKNVTNLMLVALFVAVGVLYYLHFSHNCGSNKKACSVSAASKNIGSKSPAIAFIDLDSLNEKINFIKTNRKALEAEQQAIENEWENGYRNLENEKNNFLKRAQTATQAQIEEFQNTLYQQQQQIDSKKQSLTQKLNEKSYKFLDDIQKKLKDFLATYNQDSRFTYIFSTGNGLDYMVYKDSALNITDDVVKGMNELLTKEEK